MNGKYLDFQSMIFDQYMDDDVAYRPLSKNAQFETPPDKDARMYYNLMCE